MTATAGPSKGRMLTARNRRTRRRGEKGTRRACRVVSIATSELDGQCRSSTRMLLRGGPGVCKIGYCPSMQASRVGRDGGSHDQDCSVVRWRPLGMAGLTLTASKSTMQIAVMTGERIGAA